MRKEGTFWTFEKTKNWTTDSHEIRSIIKVLSSTVNHNVSNQDNVLSREGTTSSKRSMIWLYLVTQENRFC